MKLTGKQKKYIKRCLREKPIEAIAAELNINTNDLKEYLQKRLGREKYSKIIKAKEKALEKTSLSVFNFKAWLAKKWPLLILLAILVITVYANSLNNDMLSDDLPMIRNHPEINNISYFWKSPYWDLNIRTVMVYLTHKFFGFNPIFYRLQNVVFHLGTVWAIYALATLLLGSPSSLFVAGIFAVHPILTEPVIWISGAAYVMGAFFCLSAIIAYIASLKNKNLYRLAIILAILAAEKVIVLPPILFMYEFCYGSLKSSWKRLVPFFVIGGIWGLRFAGLIGAKAVSLAPANTNSAGFHNPLIQIPTAISSYLKLIFWPDKLTLYHSELSFSRIEFSFIIFIFALFLAACTYFLIKNKRIFFWFSFFVIGLMPTLTPYKVAWVVAERYVYPSALGVIVIFVLAVKWFSNLVKIKWISYVFIGIVIIPLSTRTIVRNIDWKNQDNLWLAAARTSPSSPQNHNNLGDLYMRRGDLNQAVIEFQTAIKLKSDYSDAYHNLANTYYQKGDRSLAKENYEKAIFYNKSLWQSYQNLANMYFEEGDIAITEKYLSKAIEINPTNINLQIDLAAVLSKNNKKAEALAIIKKVLAIDPTNAKAKRVLNEIETN